MSHSTVTVVIRDCDTAAEALEQLSELLEPFDENKEDVEPYPEWMDAGDVSIASKFYRDHPEYCTEDGEGPTAPFEVYVTEGNLEAWNEWTRMACGAYGGNNRDSGIYDADEDRFGYLCTYNPKSRWDWWELGGRWHGFYQLKPEVNLAGVPVPEWRKRLEAQHPVGEDRVHGEEQLPVYDGSQDAVLGNGGTFGDEAGVNFEGRADLARKGNIDFEAMRALAGQQADTFYDTFEKATVGLEPGETWMETFRRVHFDHEVDPDETYDGYVLVVAAEGLEPIPVEEWQAKRQEIVNEARRQFHANPWITALREANLDPFMDDTHEYWCVNSGGRQAFVQGALDSVGQTHAVLLDGEWHEQGRMGWFGIVSNDKGESVWTRQFRRILDSLPDDVFLAVVDVHI
jgi:hypothetical protein